MLKLFHLNILQTTGRDRERERDMLCSRMLVPHRNKLLCGMEGRLQLLTFLKKLFYFE
jgi:hypothetical protein